MEKMKSIRTSLKVLAIIAMSAAVSVAQTPVSGGSGGSTSGTPSTSAPESVPLMSIRMLKAYALTMPTELSEQVYGASVAGSGRYVVIDYPYNDADPDHMAELLKSNPVRFTADPTEKLNSWVSYSSRKIANFQFDAFYGGTNFYLQKVGDSWRVPADALKVRLQLSDWIPVSFPGIKYAYIENRDKDGNYTGRYDFMAEHRLYPEQGILILGKSVVSQPGKLYIRYQDDSVVVYDIKNEGQKLPSVAPSPDVFGPTIDGVRSLANNTWNIFFADGDEIVKAKFTSAGTVQINFPEGLSRYPNRVYVVLASAFAKNPAIQWSEFNPFKLINFPIASGTYLIRFEYDDVPEPLPVYDGKG